MRRKALALMLLLAPALAGCGGGGSAQKADVAAPAVPVEQLYNNGMDALAAGRYSAASAQFTSVDENYPYSQWASRSQLMLAYTQYLRNDFNGSIETVNRYIQLHPANADTPYAYYLRALGYYEQVLDVQRDQKDTFDALNAFKQVVDRYPGTPYAEDGQQKMVLLRDHLAGHEMAVGRFYEQQHLYAAAIGRYQRVVQDFQTTNHVAEALERLVEVDLRLGLRTEAEHNAAVLGYNYPGSVWYADAYRDLARDHLAAAPPRGTAGGPGFLGRAWNTIF